MATGHHRHTAPLPVKNESSLRRHFFLTPPLFQSNVIQKVLITVDRLLCIISVRPPRSLCDSTIKVLVNYKPPVYRIDHVRKIRHTSPNYRHTDQYWILFVGPNHDSNRRAWTNKTDKRTDGWADGHYQIHDLPASKGSENFTYFYNDME